MTSDEPDEQLEQLDPLAPEDEARVRSLLADARETGPMPPAVVARLDEALVGLAAQRVVDEAQLTEATGYGATVHPITRSRRHRVAAVLGAAAAVAVLGLGVGAVLDNGQDGADNASSADSKVDRGQLNDADEPRVEATPGDALVTGAEMGDAERFIVGDRAFVVRSSHLTRDLARLQARLLVGRNSVSIDDYRRDLVHHPKGFACEIADWGRGILIGVRYDDAPAFVAFREPMGESQVVEVLQCGTGDLLRSTTLPVRR